MWARIITPRSLDNLIPGLDEMQEALYPRLPSIGVRCYFPGWVRLRNVARKTIFRLRVWIRRMFRRFAQLPLLVINPDGQYFGLAIPRLFRFQDGGTTVFLVNSDKWAKEWGPR